MKLSKFSIVTIVMVGSLLLSSVMVGVISSSADMTNTNTNTNSTVTISIPFPIYNLNPLFSISYYDLFAYQPIYQSLYTASNNITNNLYNWHMVPIIASSYSVAPNGTTWIFNIRPGQVWSDGIPLNASDVLFTYQVLMNPVLDPNYFYIYANYFADNSSNSMRIVNANQLVFNFLPYSLLGNQTYNLMNVYSTAILPEHVFEPLINNPIAFQTDITNSGTGINRTVVADGKTIQVNGPIGSGPYVYAGYNTTNGMWTLVANPNFNAGIQGLKAPSIKTVNIIINSNTTTALADLNSGNVQVVDYNTGLNSVYSQLNQSTVAHPVSIKDNSFQELGYDQYNPIFGMNPPNQIQYYKNIFNPSDLWYIGDGNQSNVPRTGSWITQEQIAAANANSGNVTADQWFYNHLNSTDRLNIRLAFDYAIPRANIISSIENGLGYTLPTWVTPYFPSMYDPSLQARPFNQLMAENLLNQTFGYKYNASATDYTGVPYFTLNLLVPNTMPDRILFASLVQQSFLTIGINATLNIETFTDVLNRVFFNPATLGMDYVHGGFDALFIGVGFLNLIPDFRSFVQPEYYQAGGNYYLINNTQVTQITNNIFLQADNKTANAALEQWLYNNVPSSIIIEKLDTFGIANSLTNFNPFIYNQFNYNEWIITPPSTPSTPYSPIWIIMSALLSSGVLFLIYRKRYKVK